MNDLDYSQVRILKTGIFNDKYLVQLKIGWWTWISVFSTYNRDSALRESQTYQSRLI